MANKITVNILRAFVDENGTFGNPSGIILDEEQQLATTDRQTIPTALNCTETVFINNPESANISLYNPQQETKFAGDALISTSYFISHIHLGLGSIIYSSPTGENSAKVGGRVMVDKSKFMSI